MCDTRVAGSLRLEKAAKMIELFAFQPQTGRPTEGISWGCLFVRESTKQGVVEYTDSPLDDKVTSAVGTRDCGKDMAHKRTGR